MIIDSLENSIRYESLHPHFKQAFDYLKSINFKKLQPGKIILKDDMIIINVNESKLKSRNDAKLEIHNQFIDIQIPVSAPESFGWKARTDCTTASAPFNKEKDIQFFEDIPSTYFTLQPKEFVIFFPEDAHAPCVGEGDIFKIIVKVAV